MHSRCTSSTLSKASRFHNFIPALFIFLKVTITSVIEPPGPITRKEQGGSLSVYCIRASELRWPQRGHTNVWQLLLSGKRQSRPKTLRSFNFLHLFLQWTPRWRFILWHEWVESNVRCKHFVPEELRFEFLVRFTHFQLVKTVVSCRKTTFFSGEWNNLVGFFSLLCHFYSFKDHPSKDFLR